MNDNRVLVTGASGMIGRAVLSSLLVSFPGVNIRAVFCSNHQLLPQDSRIEWVQADLLDREQCLRIAGGCNQCVMAAAYTSGSRGMQAEPWKALDNNVVMNTELLEALHFAGVRRVVFISTASVYQDVGGPIKEGDLDWNQDPHPAHFGVGWAMRFSEKLCRFWHEKTGMETVIVRAANVFGPYASFDPHRSNVVPALIRKAVDRMDPFEVWGNPSVVRDVIYVEDFADAVARLLKNESIKFDVFNVGTGKRTTVGDIVDHCLQAAGHVPSRVRYVAGAPETIKARTLDCSKIQKSVAWKPNHTIAEGIEETTRWWEKSRYEWEK
jgi:nucleoside-diphosphate-sugar epimerase